MMPRFIRINGQTREDRHDMISKVNTAISNSGAWILNFKMFSNRLINILFEVPTNNIDKLYASLLDTGLELYEESKALLEECSNQQKYVNDDFDIAGTLQVTFIHNEPDLKIDVPPFDL
ncbi:hypothetical protein Dtox_3905 [Desulfofarcimen acetoxidans DSM 771]|uniref:Uncharacterized protein n=1 Tax=Desulfofarcimen acetoxidans (strain ATCC 49208 / DSM 771 / KCTC 5769 / VKM B-1644 / 5575) TaxID=485916 RepID=C8VXW9_DESAS|nr:hypothetical protein [Desulfofarcimen acetoxidans]ACV64598.1 hypothetical protein Dtox_3905 [Desulfofarcimen acetoxidans DSM 771]